MSYTTGGSSSVVIYLARIRVYIKAQIVAALGIAELSSMKSIGEKSIGTLTDELITTRIKLHYRSIEKDPSAEEIQNLENRRVQLVEVLNGQFQQVISCNQSLGNLIVKLTEVLLQCWDAQERVMSENNLEQVGIAAREAQSFNAKRNEIIREIDTCLGDEGISVTRKTYAP